MFRAAVLPMEPVEVSSTRLRGRYSLRLCILNHNTTWDDVRVTLEAIERFGVDAVAAGT